MSFYDAGVSPYLHSCRVDALRLSTLLTLLGVLCLCVWMSAAWANEDEWWLEPRAEPAADAAPLSPSPSPARGEGGESPQSEQNAEQGSGRTVEVVLVGLPEYLQADVLASLTVQRQRNSPYLDDLLVGNLAQRAEVEAAEAMEASGFYRAKVVADLAATSSGWRLTLNFTPGPIVRISQVNVQLLGGALEQPRVVKFSSTFPLIVHAPLVHAPYERFKTQWLQLAQDVGFLDAAYTQHEILVNPDNDTAQVFLTLDSGTRYRFGSTQFDQAGPMVFELALLDGFVPWKEDEPYRVSRLLELQRTLSESQYFERMEVTPTPNRQTHTVDVVVGLSTRKQTRYAFGVGYGTDTGARVSAEMERRFLDARGDRFHGKVSLSERDVQGDLELRRPWIKPLGGTERLFGIEGFEIGGKPSTDFFSVALRSRLEELDDVDTHALSLRLSANDTKGAWRRQARVVMLYEEDELSKDDVADEPYLYGHMLLPGLNVGYRPRVRGRKESLIWDLDAQTTFGSLLSSTSLTQARVNAQWTLPVGAADQILLRGSLGTSLSGDFAKVPISLRYFAGGDQSVRGYGFKSLGPTDAVGNVVGGENLLVMSVEYDWMFANPFGMAVFVDSGNAFNGTDLSLKTGAGLGGLWRSPVGMIGLYLAHGFENEDEVVRLHFSLGAEF
ncbi:MAG: BamA/TamA family outer membrane protein [Halothiobacillaceae bacterium]|nr:BamA/TamA family outer membrane protein [Halothiobacillaceae bacterium]